MSVSSRYMPQSHRLRIAVLAAVAISLFVPLIARLWYLQVIKETAFVERAADNTTETIIELAPSDQSLEMRSLDFWRLENGLIRENWVLIDLLDIYRQIGINIFDRIKEFNKAKQTGEIKLSDGLDKLI